MDEVDDDGDDIGPIGAMDANCPSHTRPSLSLVVRLGDSMGRVPTAIWLGFSSGLTTDEYHHHHYANRGLPWDPRE